MGLIPRNRKQMTVKPMFNEISSVQQINSTVENYRWGFHEIPIPGKIRKEGKRLFLRDWESGGKNKRERKTWWEMASWAIL